MKAQKFNSDVPRKILTGMLVHDGILGAVATQVGKDRAPFGQHWLDLVARWCLDYYAKYSKAPRRHIVDRLAQYVEQTGNEDGISLVEKFLDGLGRDYAAIKADLNEDFTVDLALRHFNSVRLQRLTEQVQEALEVNEVEKAKGFVETFEQLERSNGNAVHLNKALINSIYQHMEQQEQVICFPKSLGTFLNPHFKRGDFVAFAGPEKRGKSYWLLECVWQAIRQRRRVLYYVLGDMGKQEVAKRLVGRVAHRPWKDTEIARPRRLILSEDGKSARCKRRPLEVYKALPRREAVQAYRRLLQVTACKEVPLEIIIEGGSVVSASQIENIVQRRADKDAWVPDVVVIDYVDMLAPEIETAKDEVRHQMNKTWMVLRRIALDFHCCVVTATQAAATSYKDSRWTLGKADFSEDKRKNAHATGIIGINQTSDEKEDGVYRLNWVVCRDGHWSERQVCWTAGNLALSMPCIVSALGK